MISEEILHVLQLKQTLHYQITEINIWLRFTINKDITEWKLSK